jgi:3-methyladenine DNA glycosylase AlkD
MPDAAPDLLPQALARLHQHARPGELAGMLRFGLSPEGGRLGVAVPVLRRLGRELVREGGGHSTALAQALWATGVPDAQILAALVCEPATLTQADMDRWTRGMKSWDVCDQACSNAFARSPRAWAQVPRWAARRDEFGRRAAFALLAALAVHDKAAPDSAFLATLPLIEAAADDERNFVKKAVNWALRQIGKRNAALRVAAIACAERLRDTPSRSARWIAADALRELRARA